MFLTLTLVSTTVFNFASWKYILLGGKERERERNKEHKNLLQISLNPPHCVKEKLLRALMLQRQALKEMLELKLSVEKVVYDCGAEDSHRANE